jgi:glutamate-1-semialdehyde 2,1-aminomutase
MSNYDPSRPGYWDHAGTFNNDVCSMAAGCAALGEIYTPGKAAEFFDWSEAFRASLNEMFTRMNVPMHANGIASMIAIHFSEGPTHAPSEITAGCKALRPLLHMHMLHDGVLICKRGDLFLSLPMSDEHLGKARTALANFADRHESLIKDVLASKN